MANDRPERADRGVAAFLWENAWHLIGGAALVLLLLGQAQERQSGTAGSVRELAARLEVVERANREERSRLDLVYQLRVISDAQNADVVRRLNSIESKVDRLVEARAQ
jgi:ribosomal protein S30